MLDTDGRIEKWAGLNIDIDATRRAKAALRDVDQRYRLFFDATNVALVILEFEFDEAGHPTDFRHVHINPALERISGFKRDDILGRLVTEMAPHEEAAEWIAFYSPVLTSGVPAVLERFSPTMKRWIKVSAARFGPRQVAAVFENTTVQKDAEQALRESEERQAFLLRFSDALGALTDPVEVKAMAMKLLAEQLDVMRASYFEFEEDEDHFQVTERSERDALPISDRMRMSDFSPAMHKLFQSGGTLSIEDATAPGEFVPDPAAYAAIGVQALAGVGLLRGGRLVACIGVHSRTPRQWQPADLRYITEVAERTWSAVEQARAEAALRESEERFRQFAQASAAGLWIRSAETLDMEFASSAVATIYGTEADAPVRDAKRWTAMIVPEDRDLAQQHLDRARHGKTVMHEFRIQRPLDGAFRWIRDTAFPLRNNGDVARVGGIAEDVTEAKLAVEHQVVLLAELQHRVRNIMAMIRSMVRRSADGAADVVDYQAMLDGRLLALARVQALLTRQANTGGALRDIVESEVSAQAQGGGQYVLVGPDVQLSPKVVEVLTLALHELATNALKYGALSVPEGRLRVVWAPFEKRGRTWLSIDWTEAGAPARGPVTRRGFGSDLIEGKVPYELGGIGKISIEPGGARCRLEFPLTEGESILETDAPSAATVFGGTLDMTGAPDLTGRSVLVVEDDYYLAGDTAAALRSAGATVLGPCPSEDATFDLMDMETPTHAVLDLNLGGGGPNFAIAHALKARGIPFIFLTGYDQDAIPSDLIDVTRLQKPVTLRTIVESVAQLD
ncbi:PAS domain S-box protein [Croceibacterium sp. TMG7-5b_MA50]|uniref:PAS domain S-box protein n=1 Tax=Croceibacterium sp. TMG7-5b_MA50 TaxID=3121290 RepID=UPI0032220724